MFPLELISAYPTAKVILNLRPRDEWYRSIVNSVDAKMRNWSSYIMCKFDPELTKIHRCWSKANGHEFRWDLARNAEAVYDEHAALVRGAALEREFLEFDPHQGWEPLCRFLSKEVPKTPFPSGNVAGEFHGRIEGAMKKRFGRAVRNIAAIMVVGLGAAVGGYFGWEYWAESVHYFPK